MKNRLKIALTAACAAAVMAIGAQSAAAAPKTVTITGKAYIFNHMDTAISGATIKVRELPDVTATTDAVGDYTLTVPNDTNVTPYILSGEGDLTVRPRSGSTSTQHYHWNEIDLQTFHPRGTDIVNANFQTPADFEYSALKLILGVPARDDGRPEQCAIVTTSSARDVRDVDYQTFWDRTPHGVAGATSTEFPAIDGPVYFNDSVIPDASRTESSGDGGIIWAVVPTGTYRIVTTSATTQFASFLATCAPGRVINANPPWGAYELSPGEKPLAASNVAANVTSAKAVRSGRMSRTAKIRLQAGEAINATIKVKAKGRTIATRVRNLKAGSTLLKINVGSTVTARKLVVSTTLKDASGVAFTKSRKVSLPKLG